MGRTTLQLVPVLWIAILLVFWFVIVEWKELPLPPAEDDRGPLRRNQPGWPLQTTSSSSAWTPSLPYRVIQLASATDDTGWVALEVAVTPGGGKRRGSEGLCPALLTVSSTISDAHDAETRMIDSSESRLTIARQRRFDLPELRATAWRTSAVKADSSTFSPSWMSIARRTFPSRLELKRRAGSFSNAPFAKVSFTTLL